MSHRPSSEGPEPHSAPHTWSRWSSLVRLAVWGGAPRCTSCGSPRVHRSGVARPGWTRALGLAACRCEVCLTVFDVPRKAAPLDVSPLEAEPEAELSVPAPRPEVDLTGLDREMARRLSRTRSPE